MRFEYKHFAFLGNESRRAAEAAECANEQGAFWAYHDTLFLNQKGENLGAFSDQALEDFAVALGLDEAAFNDCLESDRYQAEVSADLAEGQGRTVTSTPTIFVNDQKYPGVLSFEELQQLISAEVGR